MARMTHDRVSPRKHTSRKETSSLDLNPRSFGVQSGRLTETPPEPQMHPRGRSFDPSRVSLFPEGSAVVQSKASDNGDSPTQLTRYRSPRRKDNQQINDAPPRLP